MTIFRRAQKGYSNFWKIWVFVMGRNFASGGRGFLDTSSSRFLLLTLTRYLILQSDRLGKRGSCHRGSQHIYLGITRIIIIMPMIFFLHRNYKNIQNFIATFPCKSSVELFLWFKCTHSVNLQPHFTPERMASFDLSSPGTLWPRSPQTKVWIGKDSLSSTSYVHCLR